MHGELANAAACQPPQGLCLLSAIIRDAGYEPSIIDAVPFNWDVERTAYEVMKNHPKYVGITSYTPTIVISSKLAIACKQIAAERGQSITVMIGGPHVSFRPLDALEDFPAFDLGIVGEGEISIVEMLDALEQDLPLHGIPNLVFREGGEIVRTKRRSALADLDELPLPAWEYLPKMQKYYHPAGDNLNRLPHASLTTSRGCPAKCFFCNPRSLGNGFRGHSAEYMVKLFEQLHFDFGIRDVFISDDMFTYDRENVFRFCELIQKSKVDMSWSCFCRVDYVDPEMLAAMKKAGCWQIGFGLESGSEVILKNINKDQSVEKMEHAIRITHEAGIGVRGMFMVGSFGETPETLEETLAFIRRNPISYFHVSFFTPLPGTPAYKMAPKYGVNLERAGDLSDLTAHDPSYLPHGLTLEELVAYQKAIYRAFLKPMVFWNYLLKLKDYRVAVRILRGAWDFFRYTLLNTGAANLKIGSRRIEY